MIASIHGEITSVNDDSIVVNVGGLGFRIYVPSVLRTTVNPGERIHLHTYLVVREDALNLFGFTAEEERDFFILLLGADGIGPRTALATLSTLSIDVIRRAVLSEQPDIFSRVPGIGKKGAQKVFIHLQGKIKGGLETLGTQAFDVDTEVLDALTGLGYSVVEAQAALQSIPRDTPVEVEARLRLALQYFSG